MNGRIGIAICIGLIGIIGLLSACASNTPEAVFNRGLRALEDGDVIGAALNFEEFVEKFPDDERLLRAYDLLANCHYKMKDFASARKVFQQVREKFSNIPNLVLSCDFQIGRTYFDEGNLIKSASHFAEIASATTNPEIQSQAYSALANVYASQKRTEDAITEYEKIMKIAGESIEDPTMAYDMEMRALAGEANVYQASGEFELARDTFSRTLGIIRNVTSVEGMNPERLGLDWAKNNNVIAWAHTWARAGDYISSATIYDQLQKHPDILESEKPKLIVWKIQSLEFLFREDGEGYSPEEIAVLTHEHHRLIDEFPESDYANKARVEIASLIRDTTPAESEKYLSEAIANYEKYIAEPPTPESPISAMFNIADAYIKLDKFNKAKETLERIRKAYSSVPEAMQQVNAMMQYMLREERRRLEEKKAAQTTPTPATDKK